MKRGQSSPNSNESTVPVTAPTAKVTAMYFDQRCASRSASASSFLIARQLATSVMKPHATPSGTSTMWNASVNAICERAHGTGFTASTQVSALPMTSLPDPSIQMPLRRQLRAAGTSAASFSASATLA